MAAYLRLPKTVLAHAISMVVSINIVPKNIGRQYTNSSDISPLPIAIPCGIFSCCGHVTCFGQ